MSRRNLIFLLLLAASIAGGGLIAWRGVKTTMRIAVPASISKEGARTLQLIGREVLADSKWIKFQRVNAASLSEAASDMLENKTDIAVLRSDLPMPANAAALAVLRPEKVFLVTPSDSKIEAFSDLKNTKLGVLKGPPENEALLDKILGFYSVDPKTVTRVPVEPGDLANALKQKRITSVLVVGEPGVGQAADVYANIAKATKGAPSIVGIEETDALVAELGTPASSTIPKGAFRGVSPDEEVSTIEVEYRLIVRRDMGDMAAGELARMLMNAKAQLINEPGLAGLGPPDMEQTAYRVHPGARAYFEGEQPTLFDRFESVFWLGWALVSILGSGLTWLIGRLQGRKDSETGDFHRLVTFLGEVREADKQDLIRLRDELDGVVERLLKACQEGTFDSEQLSLYQLALSHAREALDRRATSLQRPMHENVQ